MMRRKNLILQALRQRFVVTLPGGEGCFSGVMVDYDDTYWRFEQCNFLPAQPGGVGEEIPGRLWVKHTSNPAPYLQEVEPK